MYAAWSFYPTAHKKSPRGDFSLMKKAGMMVACFILLSCIGPAQEQPVEKTSMLREFTRTAQTDGLILSFVHLNTRTVDVLFEPPGKYSLRARANQSTMFYVQGVPEKDVQLDTKFVMEQDGQTFQGVAQNIKNFQSETALAKGERIDGLLHFTQKIDPSHEFTVKNGSYAVTFKLTPEALQMLQPETPKN
jgi:hypothetical protein